MKEHLTELGVQRSPAVEAGMRRAREACAQLAQQGWTTPLWFIPRQSWQLLGSGDPTEVESNFVRFYDSDDGQPLGRVVQALLHRRVLAKWHVMLKQVVEAYGRREYAICVPALLTVLEGLLMSSAGDRIRVVSEIEKRVSGVDPESVEGWLWLAVESFVQQVYKTASFSGEKPLVINRHWILHGRDASTWGQADCLRLMQAVDTISDLDLRLPV